MPWIKGMWMTHWLPEVSQRAEGSWEVKPFGPQSSLMFVQVRCSAASSQSHSNKDFREEQVAIFRFYLGLGMMTKTWLL